MLLSLGHQFAIQHKIDMVYKTKHDIRVLKYSWLLNAQSFVYGYKTGTYRMATVLLRSATVLSLKPQLDC